MKSILVLTPLALEHSALAAALGPAAERCNNNGDGVKILSFPDMDIDLAVGGHGKVQFALSTQLLIQKLKPGLVICAGAAGSLHPELNALDVVIGESTIEHDFNLRFISRPLPQFAGDAATIEKLRRRLEPRAYQVMFGSLASGDEDILEPKRADEIRQLTKAVAVAWEGAGGARACRMHGVPFLEIRTITDAADPSAPQQFTQNIKAAMANVAEVIRLLV